MHTILRSAGALTLGVVLSVLASPESEAQILLGDIVGGGDGSGNAPGDFIGIDPRNGEFTNAPIDGHIFEADAAGDGVNPSPVADSPFVDSVFIIGEPAFDVGGGRVAPVAGGPPIAQEITLSGAAVEFPSEDGFGSSWNHILSNQNGGGGTPFMVGGQPVAGGVGVHAACGITFDLDVIRDVHGADAAGTFSTFWGMDDCGGNVNLYTIFSDDEGVIGSSRFNATQSSGQQLSVLVPAHATYLTLATGSNGGDGCDHGTFADAKLLSGPGLVCPEQGDTHCRGLEITSVGAPVLLRYPVTATATAVDDSGDAVLYRFTLTDSANNVTATAWVTSAVWNARLDEGEYTLAVEVDDQALCQDVAADNRCEIEFRIPPEPPGPKFVRGDVDGRDGLNLTDGVSVFNYLFLGGPEPGCLEAADTNNQGNVNLTSGVYVLNFLFLGGPQPPPPYPECDRGTEDDPTDLGCATPHCA